MLRSDDCTVRIMGESVWHVWSGCACVSYVHMQMMLLNASYLGAVYYVFGIRKSEQLINFHSELLITVTHEFQTRSSYSSKDCIAEEQHY